MSEERPTPKTKEQLISLMKQQLETVEDEINSMQDTLESERQKRKQLTIELQEKEKKIQELIQNQSKTLGDKISQGLYSTLETANKMRADAETEVRQLIEDNIVMNEKIVGKDTNLMDSRKETELMSKKIAVQEQKRVDAIRKEQNLIDKKSELKKNLEAMKKEHERIEYQEKELRSHIENAKKLRLYLNKALEGNIKSPNQGGNHGRSRVQQSDDSFWN